MLLEDIVDLRETIEFVPFVVVEIEKASVKHVYINIFDITSLEVISSLPCNPPEVDMPDVRVKDISLCRVSNVTTVEGVERQEKFYRGGNYYYSYVRQKVDYAITFYLSD